MTNNIRKALKVFADLGVGSGPDHETETYRIERGAIRNARAALETVPKMVELAAETSPGDVYREVIDEALIVRHLGVAKGNAKAELNQILDWDVAAALDPAVSGRKA